MSGMKGLDDYIMGTHVHDSELVSHQCPKCGQKKDVRMDFDMGGWSYPDEEAYCKECDCEMEMKDEKHE